MGGFTCRIHLRVDARGRPLAFHLTPGATHDTRGFDVLWRSVEGRVERLLADRAYDAGWLRRTLQEAETEAVIPSKKLRKVEIPYDRDRDGYLPAGVAQEEGLDRLGAQLGLHRGKPLRHHDAHALALGAGGEEQVRGRVARHARRLCQP